MWVLMPNGQQLPTDTHCPSSDPHPAPSLLTNSATNRTGQEHTTLLKASPGPPHRRCPRRTKDRLLVHRAGNPHLLPTPPSSDTRSQVHHSFSPFLKPQYWGHISRTASPYTPCFYIFPPSQGPELLGRGVCMCVTPFLVKFLMLLGGHVVASLGAWGGRGACCLPWNVWIWLDIRFRAW